MITRMDLNLMCNPIGRMNFEHETRLNPSMRGELAPLHYNVMGRTHTEQMILDDILRRNTADYFSFPKVEPKISIPKLESNFSFPKVESNPLSELHQYLNSSVSSNTCSKCDGSGRVEATIGWIFGGSNQTVECSRCNGTGTSS